MAKSARTANGRFGNGNSFAKAKRAPGSDDVSVYGGRLYDGETDAALTGRQKWIAYANAFNRPPVAISLLLRNALLGGAKWSLLENAAGGQNAKRGVEIVEQGLLKARLDMPWQEIVQQAGLAWYYGMSLHATAMGRRADGLVVYTDIAHRPAQTIDLWHPDASPFESVTQRTRDGKTHELDLSQCFYYVNRMLGDSPTGTGVLRFVVERIRRVAKYEALEGSELFSSLGGVPIARIPYEELNAKAKAHSKDPAEQAAYKSRRTGTIKEIVQTRIKDPEKLQWLALDSVTYQGQDPNTISTIQKWGIEIVKGELQGLPEIRKVITDLDLDIARILGVEVAFVGGGDTAGTYGMVESKVELLQSTTQTTLDQIGVRATQQLARRLVLANGLDPDECTPTLVPEKITSSAVTEVVQALAQMNMAGLHPKDPARAVIRERLELPPEPSPEEVLPLPRPPVDDEDPEEEPDPVDPEGEDDLK